MIIVCAHKEGVCTANHECKKEIAVVRCLGGGDFESEPRGERREIVEEADDLDRDEEGHGADEEHKEECTGEGEVVVQRDVHAELPKCASDKTSSKRDDKGVVEKVDEVQMLAEKHADGCEEEDSRENTHEGAESGHKVVGG